MNGRELLILHCVSFLETSVCVVAVGWAEHGMDPGGLLLPLFPLCLNSCAENKAGNAGEMILWLEWTSIRSSGSKFLSHAELFFGLRRLGKEERGLG